MTRRSTLLAVVLLGAACTNADISEERPGEAPTPTAVTFSEDVAPIFMENCVMCHHDDSATRPAPFSLTNYESALEWGQTGLIRYAVETRSMPPWSANDDGDCNSYKDSLWLTDDEIATIVAWAEGGFAEGDPQSMPAIPAPRPSLANATHRAAMETEFAPSSPGSDEIRCFVVDPEIATDMFVTGFEFVSSNYAVSHHGILFSLASDAAQAQVEALDAADPAPGYECFGGVGVDASRFVAGWVPGMGGVDLPAGTGVPLAAGRKVVLQMHFNYDAVRSPAQVYVDLRLAPSVAKPAQFVSLATTDISLPPKQERAETEFSVPVPDTASISVWGVVPHMHRRGLDMSIELDSDTGSTCIARIDNWDFDWQRMYFYEDPLTMLSGDELRVRCGYDTLGDSETTVWGEGTSDEMCVAFLYVTTN